MIDELIVLILLIWRGDSEMRENSLVGQSEMDRKSGRIVAWICGGLVALLMVAGVLWWWFVEM